MTFGRRLLRILRAKARSYALPSEHEPASADDEAAPERERDHEVSDERRWLAILELSEGASEAEIRAAYLRLSKRYHPDRFQSTPDKREAANELMQEINRAYRKLTARGGVE